MIFKHGSFIAAATDNFAWVGGDTAIKRSPTGAVESIIRSLRFEFYIKAAGQVAIDTRLKYIIQQLSKDGVDSGFFLPDGSPSRLAIRSAETVSGVYVITPPSPIADREGSDFATGCKGVFAIAADYLPAQFGFAGLPSGPSLASYSETCGTQGNGGPRTTFVEYDQGAPQEYVLADRTKVTGFQAGFATFVGAFGGFPTPNPPYFPDNLMNESEAVQRTATQTTGGKWENVTTWDYRYERATQFGGQQLLPQKR